MSYIKASFVLFVGCSMLVLPIATTLSSLTGRVDIPTSIEVASYIVLFNTYTAAKLYLLKLIKDK